MMLFSQILISFQIWPLACEEQHRPMQQGFPEGSELLIKIHHWYEDYRTHHSGNLNNHPTRPSSLASLFSWKSAHHPILLLLQHHHPPQHFLHNPLQRHLHQVPFHVDLHKEMNNPSNLHNFGSVDRILLGLVQRNDSDMMILLFGNYDDDDHDDDHKRAWLWNQLKFTALDLV